MTNFFFNYNGENIPYFVDGENVFVDAKPLIKGTFTSAVNYLTELQKNPAVKTEGGRTPIWCPIDVLSNFFTDKQNATRTETGQAFSFASFKDALYDMLYDSGKTQFVSDRRKAETEAKEKQEAKENKDKIAKLELELKRLNDEKNAKIELEKERARAGVNPVIRLLNDVWFPVLMSGIFALVIGGFSYEILSHTMGLNKWLNFLLAVAYVMFPLLTAIRQYNFDFGFVKIAPLWIVMVIDMVFTAYHVGWLRTDNAANHTVEIASLHPMLKIVYIIIIPLMQKATNDMILKIRATYLMKGWLPKID